VAKDYSVHPTSIVEKTAKIGKGTQIWHFSHIMDNVSIGENCKFGQNVYIGQNVIIGNNVKIQNNVSVYPGVTLEDDVFCGPSMVFTNIINPRSAYPRNTSDHYKETLVKKGATIGANATIICGVTLNEHCFIGAGSVVTKDVLPFALCYGNPAKQKGWACVCGVKLVFQAAGNEKKAVCSECSTSFRETGGKIERV